MENKIEPSMSQAEMPNKEEVNKLLIPVSGILQNCNKYQKDSFLTKSSGLL